MITIDYNSLIYFFILFNYLYYLIILIINKLNLMIINKLNLMKFMIKAVLSNFI